MNHQQCSLIAHCGRNRYSRYSRYIWPPVLGAWFHFRYKIPSISQLGNYTVSSKMTWPSAPPSDYPRARQQQSPPGAHQVKLTHGLMAQMTVRSSSENPAIWVWIARLGSRRSGFDTVLSISDGHETTSLVALGWVRPTISSSMGHAYLVCWCSAVAELCSYQPSHAPSKQSNVEKSMAHIFRCLAGLDIMAHG